MLSDKLESVISVMNQVIAGEVAPTPELLRQMRTVLLGAQATARTLERLRVPDTQRLTLAHLQESNVTLFPCVSRRPFRVLPMDEGDRS